MHFDKHFSDINWDFDDETIEFCCDYLQDYYDLNYTFLTLIPSRDSSGSNLYDTNNTNFGNNGSGYNNPSIGGHTT